MNSRQHLARARRWQGTGPLVWMQNSKRLTSTNDAMSVLQVQMMQWVCYNINDAMSE